MNVSQKLFLTLLLLVCSVLSVSLTAANSAFNAGFSLFITQLEEQRLGALSAQLEQLYVANEHSWENIDINQITFFRGPPRTRGPQGRESLVTNLAPNKRGDSAEQTGQRAERPYRRPARPKPLHLTGLFSPQGEFLSGDNTSQQPLLEIPITVQGQVIGYLKSWDKKTSSGAMAQQFYQKYQNVLLLIGLLSLLVTSCASYFLVTVLLKPVHKMMYAVRELSAGNFSAKTGLHSNDELGILSRDIDLLSQKLEKSQSERKRFFADLSHELRTPLTILQGELDLLKTGIRHPTADNLQSLAEEVLRLDKLINDIYDLSLTDLGALQYRFSTFNFTNLCEEFTDKNLHLAREKGIIFSCAVEPDIEFRGDRDRINQLLQNLFMNSLAYTDSPGQILLTLQEKHEQIVLTMTDSAPTIPSDILNKVTAPLFRGDAARTRRDSGAGLGLSICHNIATAHQGVMLLSQSDIGGVRVVLTLPKSV